MIRYLSENQCLDGPLGRSLDVYNTKFKSDRHMVNAALAMVIIGLAVHLFFFILCNSMVSGKNCLKDDFKEEPVQQN